jgi:hypothetical protein
MQIVNYGTRTAQASGQEHQEVHKAINDNSAILALLEKIMTAARNEAVTKAAGKLGESAVSLDWQNGLHQLCRQSSSSTIR